MHTSTHTALYDPDGLIEAELPLDREPYESLVDWTPPSPAAVRTRWISPPAPSPLPCPTCCGGPRRAALWADWERPDRARQGCPRVDRRGHTHDPRLRANRPPTDRPRPCHCLRRTTPRRPTAEGQRAQGARRRRPARGRRPTVRAAGGHRALRPGPRPDGACPVRAPGPPRGSRTAGTLEGPHPGFSGRGPVFRTRQQLRCVPARTAGSPGIRQPHRITLALLPSRPLYEQGSRRGAGAPDFGVYAGSHSWYSGFSVYGSDAGRGPPLREVFRHGPRSREPGRVRTTLTRLRWPESCRIGRRCPCGGASPAMSPAPSTCPR
jgi:hypothetical protein